MSKMPLMTTLKTYFKSDDAYVAASLLESEGIDAIVIEDSAYGGSLLGTTGSSIRIEVPEAQLERAQALLASIKSEAPPREEEIPDTKIQTIFRRLVVVDLVVVAAGLPLGRFFYHTPPAESDAVHWIASLAVSFDLWEVMYMLWIPILLMDALASILLFFYIQIGRWLYLGTVALGLISFFAYPPAMPTAFGGLFSTLSLMLTSAVITLMFVPEVAERFRKHIGDRE